MTLEQLYTDCLEKCGQNKILTAQRFLLAARKMFPEVKISECANISGYKDPKDRQNFRNSVVNQLRVKIGAACFNLTDEQVKRLFSSSTELTEEENAIKDKILEKLPQRDRRSNSVGSKVDHLSDLL